MEIKKKKITNKNKNDMSANKTDNRRNREKQESKRDGGGEVCGVTGG
jgi:hypothetical protein